MEPEPAWLEEAAGVLLDSFSDRSYDISFVSNLLQAGKRVCVASPELHGRTPGAYWHDLRVLQSCEQLMLCTDYPVLAREFFQGAQ